MMARWWQCEGRGLKTCWVSGQWWIFSDQNGLFCFVTNILNVPIRFDAETCFIISTWLCTPLNIHIWIPVYLWCIHHVYLLSLVKNSVSSLCPTNPGPVTGGNWSLSVVKSWGLLCEADAASSQKYRRIFLGAASGALNVSLFINPQLFLSSPRKKKQKTHTGPLHSCLEISCSDHSYVQFQQPCPLCVLSSTSHSLWSCCVGCAECSQSDQSVYSGCN